MLRDVGVRLPEVEISPPILKSGVALGIGISAQLPLICLKQKSLLGNNNIAKMSLLTFIEAF